MDSPCITLWLWGLVAVLFLEIAVMAKKIDTVTKRIEDLEAWARTSAESTGLQAWNKSSDKEQQ